MLFGLPMPMAKAFGLRGEEIGDDRARVRMPPDPAHTNSRGDVHGGAFAVLMDCTLASATRAHAPTRYGVVTIDLSLHFVAPCASDVIATATCERRGRSLCFARGEARNAQGDLLALATGTFKLVERSS
ncbi:PaaI family thioesterase [Variovorax sp. J2P1-59]|uniref:PaaI family thioesterase n=1 Tax=Variovorax flavidus TaxID=3053501 RepID=UPI002575AE15|nr:PaaI family thioesterase [Variovorax sp. J2P1-59]MDM0076216.1 PaaI family thioesterase [Variovorax sp. J2P1-59]